MVPPLYIYFFEYNKTHTRINRSYNTEYLQNRSYCSAWLCGGVLFHLFWEGGSHRVSPIDIPLDTTHGNSCQKTEGEREWGREGEGERESMCRTLSFQSDSN